MKFKEFSKSLPYFLPVAVTAFFILLVFAGIYWPGPLLLPLVTLLHRFTGRFSKKEMIEAYRFFHHTPEMEYVRAGSGLFFIGFNAWVVWTLTQAPLASASWLLFVYSVILLNANFSVSLAHELMHSRSPFSRFLATILLVSNGFFYLESDHIYIHHRYVGTEKDPASAKKGESLYGYLFRSVPARLKMFFGKSDIFPVERSIRIVRSIRFRFLICLVLLSVSALTSLQVFGWLLIQFLAVPLIYEAITYIQHYGRRRTYFRRGGFEPVGIVHSWNCNYRLSAYLYYMMPAHSIHHLAVEPDLKFLDDPGPVFPLPFTRMAVCAFFPRLWFRLMNPLLENSGLN